MFCRKCGQEIKQGAKFCIKCGTPILQQQSEQPIQPVAEKKIQPVAEKKMEPVKSKSRIGIIVAIAIVSVLCIVCLVLGAYLFLEIRESEKKFRENEIQEQMKEHGDDRREENPEVTESIDTEMASSTETEVEDEEDLPRNQAMTVEQFVADLPMCNINGMQYGFTKESSVSPYTTEGLKGANGCLYYNAADLDRDGEEEIFTFWIRENEENGNDILIRVYENKEEGYEIADEAVVLEGALGAYCDSADIRFLLKDNTYICVDSCRDTYLAADGVSLDMHVYGYDGEMLKEHISDSISGSDFSGAGVSHTDTIQKLESVGMYKSAENIRLRDNFTFCIGDAGLESLAKLWVENSYQYSADSTVQSAPMATCHWIIGNEREYILKNSAAEYITERDVKVLDAEQLRIARNEIYARYGWGFDDEALRRYFNEKSWYMPGSRIEEEQLSEIEVFNRDLIQGMEEKLK